MMIIGFVMETVVAVVVAMARRNKNREGQANGKYLGGSHGGGSLLVDDCQGGAMRG
jgi:hypothetical protein